ncbi:MAG: flippase [Bryobacteraceae bacterium]
MKPSVARYRQSTLARNTAWMFLGQGLRLIIQAGYFVIIARSLGPEQYGSFVAVTALVAIFAPFVGIGSDKLLIKNVARDVSLLDECFGNGVVMTITSGLAAGAIILNIARYTLPSSVAMTIVVMVAFSDLVCSRLLDLAAGAFQSLELLGRTAMLNVLLSATRLAGIAALVAVTHHASALSWSVVYAATTAVAMVTSLVFVRTVVTSFKLSPGRIKCEIVQGLYFSGGQSAQSIYNDVDKTMLARLATLDANGIYAAAYRLIDVAFVPVRSLLFAAYPGFFRYGEGNLEDTYRYARRLLRWPLIFSSVSFVALFVFAPIVPAILGSQYIRTVEALRWLSPLPLLKTAHYFFADALTGAGYQGLRMTIQIIVALFNVLLNLWIIPAYSWRGAAWSSLASDALLLVSLWLVIAALRRRKTNRVATFEGVLSPQRY